MKRLRHAWHVLADKPASKGATELRQLMALVAGSSPLGVLMLGWGSLLNAAFVVVWLYTLLWVVRQRDEARHQLATKGE